MCRYPLATLLCLVPFVLQAAPVPKDKPKVPPDSQRILGAWDVYSDVNRVGAGTATVWTFTEGKMHSNSGDTDWTVKLDPSQSPKRITLTQIGGTSTHQGIYEFDDDKLRIHLASGQVQPKDFVPVSGMSMNTMIKSKNQPAK